MRIPAGAQNAAIQFDGNTFKVSGWSPPDAAPAKGWPSLFAVYAGSGDVPPLLGSYTVADNALVFHPQFPVAPGVKYRAVFHPSAGASLEKTFDGPRPDSTPTARVLNVYPSGDVLPSNQLRLYIYFSAPMSRGEAAQYTHVLDDKGKDLVGSRGIFLPGEELWDPGFTRLTMTFDPGRIKRGLTSNMNIGPPIVPGNRYTLVIDRDWQDAHGASMAGGYTKSFRGGPAERTPPDPKQWRITAPKAGTSDALIVDFPEPMNFVLLQRMLQVVGSQGRVDGTVNVDHQETRWQFTPRIAWKAGDYNLVVDTGIEDLAGNHIGQPFDVDTFDHVTEKITSTSVSLPLAIR